MHNNWHDAQQSQPNQPIEKYFVFHGANLAQRTHLVLEEMTNAVCLAKRSVGHSVVWINHVQMAAMAEFSAILPRPFHHTLFPNPSNSPKTKGASTALSDLCFLANLGNEGRVTGWTFKPKLAQHA
jgi:hypothetical protein